MSLEFYFYYSEHSAHREQSELYGREYSTAQVKEPKNSLFRISAFRELAKNTRNQTE